MDVPNARRISRRRELDNRERVEIQREHQTIEVSTPLIDPSIVDLASQRLFIVSFYVLIQCCKIYDVILLKSGVERYIVGGLVPLNNFTFIIKYAIADGFFLWFLPILNVPYITFSPFITLLLTISTNIFTFILASDTTIPIIASMVLPLWNSVFNRKELTIIGDAIPSHNVIDMNSHFKGKYTINYLPDSSAYFNPFKFDGLCLDPIKSNDVLHIPVEFNTTNELGFLQLQYTNDQNDVSYTNYTRYDLSRLVKRDYSHLKSHPKFVDKKDPRIFYLEVPLSKPGMYRISSVKDVKGISIRTFKSTVLLSNCPTARFLPSQKQSSPICLGNKPSFENVRYPDVELSGVAPLNLKFATKLNGKSFKNFELNVGENSSERLLKDLSWLKSQKFVQDLIKKEIEKPNFLTSNDVGHLEIHILEIGDSLSHYRKFNPTSKDKDIFFELDIVREPSIRLLLDDDELLLVNSTKKLSFASSIRKEDYPLSISMSFEHSSDPLLSKIINHTFKNPTELMNGFKISEPGTFTILSGHDKFCSCNIDQKFKSVNVQLASLPSVEISGQPIIDKCVGSTGYNFSLQFSGKPPFQVEYQVFQEQKNGALRPVATETGATSRYLKSMNSNLDFAFSPPREGKYLIVFQKLKDMNYYKNPILLDDKKHTYSTYFKKRSRAYLINEERKSKVINSCLNETTSIPLYFKGNFPFKFDYQILDKTGKSLLKESVSDCKDNVYDISSPILGKGGEYKIVVSNIQDGLSCDAEFDTSVEVKVKTRKDIPEIGFDMAKESSKIKLIEGEAKRIPIKLKSSLKTSNVKVEYEFVNKNGDSQIRAISSLDSFFVKEEGLYRLVSFKSGRCSGAISQENVIEVSYYDRPTLSLKSKEAVTQIENQLQLKSICQNCEQIVYLNLEGSKPFVVDYEVTLPSGKVEVRSVSVEGNEMKILLPTDTHGKFKHVFKNVFDSLYTREKTLGKYKGHNLASATYTVNELPTVVFDKNDKFSLVCESNVNDFIDIPVTVKGAYPMNVSISLTHETTRETEKFYVENINSPFLHLDLNSEKMTVGNHVLNIEEIIDGNGCVQNSISRLNNYIIKVTEVPTMNKKIEKNHFCVGEHIWYNLTGFPPFTVYYNFDGKLQKAESGHSFRRLASKPGNLSIMALQDSSPSTCLVNFTNTEHFDELKLQVHEVPSVEINQGDTIITDIHEGEQTEITFSFQGVPPFTLTYTRSIMVADKKKRKEVLQVVDTKTIKDIWEDEITIRASLEGTYEAVELHDAYCVAKRYENE